jgi:putative membrane protein
MRKSAFALIVLASAAVLPSALIATVTAGPALADEAELAGQDTQFLAKAIISGRGEVELSQIAAQKASQPQVKQFAERMVKDHTAVNDKLMNEAQRHKIETTGTYGTPPLEPNQKAQMTKEQLEGLSGDKLDKAYMQRMIQDHVQAVALFQDEAKNGKDRQLRDLASDTLPTLQDHLKQAREIGSKVGVAS